MKAKERVRQRIKEKEGRISEKKKRKEEDTEEGRKGEM
jgi:hypothetical protein